MSRIPSTRPRARLWVWGLPFIFFLALLGACADSSEPATEDTAVDADAGGAEAKDSEATSRSAAQDDPGAAAGARSSEDAESESGSGPGSESEAGASSDPDEPPAPWFEESAAAAGLDFVHDSGHRERYFIPEIVSGGAAVFDMDGDGAQDLYLVQSGVIEAERAERSPNRLYRNRGDGTFVDVTEESGAGDRGYGMSAAVGDYDNDGDLDLYVCNLEANTFLRNEGDGRFTDVTEATGTAGDTWSAAAAFLDYDADGFLDLFVVNYIHWTPEIEQDCYIAAGRSKPDYCGPISYGAPARDQLFRNRGDGTFVEVSLEAGLEAAFGNGLGVVSGDFDDDGRQDVFVANDGLPNQLWLNRGEGRFEDMAPILGTAVDESGVVKAGMGVDAADVDGDGDQDILVGNQMGETDSLYLNQDGSYFVDGTARLGIAGPSMGFTRFGLGFVDFDNDERLDLYEANGRVRWDSRFYDPEDPFAEPNTLLRGLPDGRFEPVEPQGGTSVLLAATSRAAAFGDLDGDGGLDIVVVNRDAPAYLLRNVREPRGRWLRLRLLDRNGRDAIGARVTLRVGERRIVRELRSAYGYASASELRVHVGLGEAGAVDGISVRWVGGAEEEFGAVEAVDREVVLQEGEGEARQ